jgi:hypothetical protein
MSFLIDLYKNNKEDFDTIRNAAASLIGSRLSAAGGIGLGTAAGILGAEYQLQQAADKYTRKTMDKISEGQGDSFLGNLLYENDSAKPAGLVAQGIAYVMPSVLVPVIGQEIPIIARRLANNIFSPQEGHSIYGNNRPAPYETKTAGKRPLIVNPPNTNSGDKMPATFAVARPTNYKPPPQVNRDWRLEAQRNSIAAQEQRAQEKPDVFRKIIEPPTAAVPPVNSVQAQEQLLSLPTPTPVPTSPITRTNERPRVITETGAVRRRRNRGVEQAEPFDYVKYLTNLADLKYNF